MVALEVGLRARVRELESQLRVVTAERDAAAALLSAKSSRLEELESTARLQQRGSGETSAQLGALDGELAQATELAAQVRSLLFPLPGHEQPDSKYKSSEEEDNAFAAFAQAVHASSSGATPTAAAGVATPELEPEPEPEALGAASWPVITTQQLASGVQMILEAACMQVHC